MEKMKIPYVEAKDNESDNTVKGFYFEYPETTYCFTEDYEREPKVKLIPCVMTHRMTDWGLPNIPIICRPIDKSTLRILGYVDTDIDYYMPTNYVAGIVRKGGWIPCSERLPEEYGEYLCCDKYGEYIIGYPTARVSSDDYYVETEYEIMNDCIAWQPIQPYKKGSVKNE